MKDKKTVSNDYYELKAVAKKLGCRPSDVLRAKEELKTTSRFKIEKYILEIILFKPSF